MKRVMFFRHKKDAVEVNSGDGHGSWALLNEENGCTGGCCTGISYYSSVEYTAPAVHDDQEGFYVIQGLGWAKIGEEEFSISPEMSIIVPAGNEHQIKSDNEKNPVYLFWFHAKA